MKILILGWELPPHNSGGLGVACLHMARALAEKGSEIDFVVPYDAIHEGIDFMNIHAATPLSPLDRYGLNAYDTTVSQKKLSKVDENNLSDMRGVQKRYGQFVEQLIEQEVPEVIHAHDWLTLEAGVLAKQKTGAPLVAHVHATEFDRAGGGLGNPVIHDIEQTGLLLADRIIAVSQLTKNLIIHNYHIPAEKIEVVHNALDIATLEAHTYDNSTYRYLERLRQDGHTIVTTVTRFTMQKGLTHLMKAAARACQVHDKMAFLFAGDGEQRDELIRLSAAYGISDKVFFTGFVRGKQWRDAYSVSDVFVMSSVSEPFGLTALEAAHYNCALVLTKQSGVSEVIRHSFMYDFWDTELLANQLVALATSSSLQDTMKHNANREYTRISWSDVAEKCLHIYKKAGAFA